MPARPHFYLILGVTNFTEHAKLREGWVDDAPAKLPTNLSPKSKKIDPDKHVRELRYVSINSRIEGKQGADLLFVEGGLFGLKVDDLILGHDITLALADSHAEYKVDGHRVLPQVALADDQSKGAIHLRKVIAHAKRRKKSGLSVKAMRPFAIEANIKKKMLNLGLNYPQYGLTIETLVSVLAYVGKWVGVKVDWSDVRLILVWRWK